MNNHKEVKKIFEKFYALRSNDIGYVECKNKCENYLKRVIYGLGENIRWKNSSFIEQMKSRAFELAKEVLYRRQFPVQSGESVFTFFNRLAWRDFTFAVTHKVFEA